MLGNKSKSINQELRVNLALLSSSLPNQQLIDSKLWYSFNEALRVHNYDKELNWLPIGMSLIEHFKNAPSLSSLVANLSGSANCSFKALISESQFINHFGRSGNLPTLHKDYQINYFQSRFASTYWCSVRDFAVKSKLDCISIFHLPKSIIEILAESTTAQILDFCHGLPELQRFSLRCPEFDCITIAKLTEEEVSKKKTLLRKMTFARLNKANHCSIGDASVSLWY